MNVDIRLLFRVGFSLPTFFFKITETYKRSLFAKILFMHCREEKRKILFCSP